jgi:hypothetical protein
MLFCNEITQEEKELGFVVGYVENPKGAYYGQPSIIPLTIKPIQASYRMMKLRNPDRGFSYPIYCYHSTPTSRGRAEWGVVVDGTPSPEETLKSYKVLGDGPWPYTPELASMKLCCPKCKHEFSVQKDHLPFPGQTACPQCKHQADTAEFAALA